MKSKADIVRQYCRGRCVLDIGGTGYDPMASYSRELATAWRVCKDRIVMDSAPTSDIICDLNRIPYERSQISELCQIKIDACDITVAFDVLEHLENPIAVLRWLPTKELIVTLPNEVSPVVRWLECHWQMPHLYSWTSYTAKRLLMAGGWRITREDYIVGAWSSLLRVWSRIGNLWPAFAATGIAFHCIRQDTT